MSEMLSIRIMKRADKGLGGEWLTLPATPEQLKAALNKIGMTEAVRKDILMSDFRTSLSVLDNAPLVTNADLNELNYLAARLAGLDPFRLKTLEAVGETPYHLKKQVNFLACQCHRVAPICVRPPESPLFQTLEIQPDVNCT